MKNVHDPRNLINYTLVPPMFEGATPMMEAVWTAVWACARNPNSRLSQMRREGGIGDSLVPISPRIALSLRERGVQWVHVCHPRLLYKRLRSVLSHEISQGIGKRVPVKDVKIQVYEEGTLGRFHLEKYRFVVNDNFVSGFHSFIDYEVHYNVGLTLASRSKCIGCWKYTLTGPLRSMIAIQNLGRGINHD